MSNKTKTPKTINDAVRHVIALMTEEEKEKFRQTKKDELANFQFGTGIFIRNKFGLDGSNKALIEACALTQQGNTFNIFYQDDPNGASEVIIEAVWKHLKSTSTSKT